MGQVTCIPRSHALSKRSECCENRLSLIKGNTVLLAEHGHQCYEAGTQVSESLESVSDRQRFGALDSSDE
jgi:hypothetical protein